METMNLKVTPRSLNPNVQALDLEGEVDVYTAPQLRSALEEQVAMGRTSLVLDLEGVGFLDSTGLGVLVGRLKATRQLGGWFGVVCTSERILRLLAITGLDRVLPIHETVESAIEAAAAGTEEPQPTAWPVAAAPAAPRTDVKAVTRPGRACL